MASNLETKLTSYGVLIGILALLGMFIGFWINYPKPISKDDLIKITDRYDPVFKNILIRDAYQILADIRISEIKNHPELINKMKEIEVSLELVGAFNEHRNKGIQEIFNLIYEINSSDDKFVPINKFLSNDITLSSYALTPTEHSYILSYQGLCYLMKMRNAKTQEDYIKYLRKAYNKFDKSKSIANRISNTWNGMGICLLAMAHKQETLDLNLIDQARLHFNNALYLNRSTMGLATQINNATYASLVASFYATFKITYNNEGFKQLKIICDKKAINSSIQDLRKAIEMFKSALLYDPKSIAITLSLAESYCMLALCDEGRDCKEGERIVIKPDNQYILEAMKLFREAKEKGYTEWEYLFSRYWVSNSVFRLEDYSKELSEYL